MYLICTCFAARTLFLLVCSKQINERTTPARMYAYIRRALFLYVLRKYCFAGEVYIYPFTSAKELKDK